MANRRLYNNKSFVVTEILKHDTSHWDGEAVWHLVGTFTGGSIRSIHDRKYRIRVKPDPRFDGAREVAFLADSVYECESIASRSRRHIYGSGMWYISPHRPGNKWNLEAPSKFAFEDFRAVKK